MVRDLPTPPATKNVRPANDDCAAIEAPSPVAPVFRQLAREVAALSADHGRRVDIRSLAVLDRSGHLELQPPTDRSPNGGCRLFRSADGWLALNLVRPEDASLIPAWLRQPAAGDVWDASYRGAADIAGDELLSRGQLLGLPLAKVGEVGAGRAGVQPRPMGSPMRKHPARPLVVDLSALWAGPLCGAILAAMGADVVRIESLGRPDPSRVATPRFFANLNAAKAELALDLRRAGDRERLHLMIAQSDVLITSARPRALAALGLTPADVFRRRPHLTWVAITAYGWTGAAAQRVGFGDDTAAAGGLVDWTPDGRPLFMGDALADPITGLEAAVSALRALSRGGGVLVDAALARCAAAAAEAIAAEQRT